MKVRITKEIGFEGQEPIFAEMRKASMEDLPDALSRMFIPAVLAKAFVVGFIDWDSEELDVTKQLDSITEVFKDIAARFLKSIEEDIK